MAHIVIAGDWTTLDKVRNGAVVDTGNGVLVMVTRYSEDFTDQQTGRKWSHRNCYLLTSGESAWWGGGHDHQVRCRPLELVLVDEQDPHEQYTHLHHLTENVQAVVDAVGPLTTAVNDLNSWLPTACEDDE